MRTPVTRNTEYFSAITSGSSEETSMFSSRGAVPVPSGGHVSRRIGIVELGSAPDSFANLDVFTGGLIDELEGVRTDVSSLSGRKFVNHTAQRTTPSVTSCD